MPARLRTADPSQVGPALDRFRAGSASPDDLRLLTKHFLALLVARAPGAARWRSGCRRTPWRSAVAGTRHTRGTPPAVVEMEPATWVALAVGDLLWGDADRDGLLVASGERSDLSALLPLAFG